MNETQQQFQDVFTELYKLDYPGKKKFIEGLLFYFTIAGRAIYAAEKETDANKLAAFNWLNELTQRVCNLNHDLQHISGDEFVTRLYDNIKFYGGQSELLRIQLMPTTISAFEFIKRTMSL